jgi:hypothetical protein
MGLPAPYMGEKVCNPLARGGVCDTMGERELLPLPDLPGAEEHSEKMRQRLKGLPDNASEKEKDAAFEAATRDAPSCADYATMFESKEYKEVERKNNQIKKENAAKKKRADALKRGETVNMKRDKCIGDPKI